jgi:ribonucleoside-diphosphate reductase alpha chain
MGMEFIPGYREANAPPRTQGIKHSAEIAPLKEGTQWSEIESSKGAGKGPRGSTNGSNRIPDQSPLSSMGSGGPARIDALSPPIPSSVGGPNAPGSTGHLIVQTRSVLDRSVKIIAESAIALAANPLDQSNAALMGDAPACDGCGSITVRNGNCYKCMNCGNSMGCS